ncbi:MAG: hypothetical protein ABUL60_12985 [Myxococcales bacterium]
MKGPARLLVASFALFSAALPHSAVAQPNGDTSEAAATAYRRALAMYDSGDLPGALASMRESYRLSQRAELLYNIARLESELHDCAASLADYRLYVQQVPDGRYRSEADQATQELAQRCPDAPPTPAAAASSSETTAGASVKPPAVPAASHPVAPPEPASPALSTRPQPASPTYWTAPRWIGWSLVAASAVAGVSALYFRAGAVDARSNFQTSVNNAQRSGSLPDYSLRDRQHQRQNWAAALGVTGGALLAGGVLVLVFAPTPGASNTTAGLYIEPGLLGACLSHSF